MSVDDDGLGGDRSSREKPCPACGEPVVAVRVSNHLTNDCPAVLKAREEGRL